MSKFKVGDKVRVIKASNLFRMSRLIGKVGIISRDDGSGVRQYRLDIDDPTNPWSESELELVEPRREFIVIRRSGAETIAELRHDREVIKSAKATCAPLDTFDLDTGAKLAFDRLMGREMITFSYEIAPDKEPQPAHRFKVGDRVETEYGIGEIVYVCNDDLNVPYLVYNENWVGCSGYLAKEFDVQKYGRHCRWFCERLLSPAPEPPKFYTGKVLMIGCDYPDRNHLINHLFEFKDGKYIGHEMRGIMFHYEPYTSFDYIKSVHTASTWIEVKE